MPPWKRFTGRVNDCWSPVQLPRLLVQVAPLAVQFRMQRLRPPLLLPCQKMLLGVELPAVVPPRNPLPFIEKLALLILLNGTALPAVPGTVDVTITVAPLRTAVAVP